MLFLAEKALECQKSLIASNLIFQYTLLDMNRILSLLAISLVLSVFSSLVFTTNNDTNMPIINAISNELADGSLKLILDQTEELGAFRKINDPYPEDKNFTGHYPTRDGLDQLHYSASAQFSEAGLNELQEKLAQKDLIIIDLRRESHGFINGLPVSWMNIQNGWSNLDLNTEAISEEEKALLKAAQKEEHVVINKVVKEEGNKELIPMPTTVKRTSTERNLTAKLGIGYVRIPICDHKRPLDEEIDTFISFYRTKPETSWVHFHCKGGSGRTTTLLVMVDMMHNAKQLSFDTIMDRQMLINEKNFLVASTPIAKQFFAEFEERRLFLREFYNYCKENQDNFATSWATYLTKKPA